MVKTRIQFCMRLASTQLITLHDQEAFYFQISLPYENCFGIKSIPVFKTFLYSSLTAFIQVQTFELLFMTKRCEFCSYLLKSKTVYF